VAERSVWEDPRRGQRRRKPEPEWHRLAELDVPSGRWTYYQDYRPFNQTPLDKWERKRRRPPTVAITAAPAARTSLRSEPLDAHHQGSGADLVPCAFPDGHGLVERKGVCCIGSKTPHAAVTIYEHKKCIRGQGSLPQALRRSAAGANEMGGRGGVRKRAKATERAQMERRRQKLERRKARKARQPCFLRRVKT
jgi:hypothetical protein